MPVLRVDDEVYEAIKKRAVELDLVFGGPNDVLRYDYLKEKTKKEMSPTTATEDVIEIEYNSVEASRRHALIYIPKDKRSFFPGYKVRFMLSADGAVFTPWVTSASKGTPLGDPNAGHYIQGHLRDWYDGHPDLKPGDRLRFEATKPGERYKLSIVPDTRSSWSGE